MKSMYLRNSHYEINGEQLPTLITKLVDMDSVINKGHQEYYKEIPRVKYGDYITCCEKEDSIFPKFGNNNTKGGHWRKDHTFRSEGIITSRTEAAFSVEGGGIVFVNFGRLATEEEIAKVKK